MALDGGGEYICAATGAMPKIPGEKGEEGDGGGGARGICQESQMFDNVRIALAVLTIMPPCPVWYMTLGAI